MAIFVLWIECFESPAEKDHFVIGFQGKAEGLIIL
jgi:hypothetical protein